jgi:[ribosomal protein S5]-alanine N-acetyltransferase
LLRAAQGRGYATEAGRAVIAWACATGQPRLWATVWDWNVASRKVLRKLEFRETSEVVSVSVHGRSLLATRALLAGSRPHAGSVAWHEDGAAAGESGTR